MGMFNKKPQANIPNIDFVRMVKENEQFNKYVGDVLTQMVFLDKGTRDSLLFGVWSFYNSDMTPEQAAKLILNLGGQK